MSNFPINLVEKHRKIANILYNKQEKYENNLKKL